MRTLDQNQYYWGVVVQDALKFYSTHEKEFLLDVYRALGNNEGADVIHAMFKILFNGGHSTRFKDDERGEGKEKMGNYIDSIREHFYREHKFDIPPANTPRIDYEAN